MANVEETPMEALRRTHVTFICKVYLWAVGMVTAAVTQWLVITPGKRAAKLLKKYDFFVLSLAFLNFLMMLPMQCVLRSERPKARIIMGIYIILTAEIGSATLAIPVAQSTAWHLVIAAALTLCPVVVSFCIAFRFHLEKEYGPVYLTIWTMKYFLATSICVPMTLTFDNLYVQISIALLFAFFISSFIVVWGRSLGSLVFYREELSHLSFYITLAYLIVLSLFANALVFFQKIRMLSLGV